MSDLCPTCGGAVRPSTICVCGLARNYHGRLDSPPHEYERRYFTATPGQGDGLDALRARIEAIPWNVAGQNAEDAKALGCDEEWAVSEYRDAVLRALATPAPDREEASSP